MNSYTTVTQQLHNSYTTAKSAILMLCFLTFSASLTGQFGFTAVPTVDGCCISFTAIANEGTDIVVTFGDETISSPFLRFNDYTGDTILHCYETNDTFEIVIWYYKTGMNEPLGGASLLVPITDCFPFEPQCSDFWICYEDLENALGDCAYGIEYKDSTNTPQSYIWYPDFIFLPVGFTTISAWEANFTALMDAFLAQVDPGAYFEIVRDEATGCTKNNEVVPAYVIRNTQWKEFRFLVGDCNLSNFPSSNDLEPHPQPFRNGCQ